MLPKARAENTEEKNLHIRFFEARKSNQIYINKWRGIPRQTVNVYIACRKRKGPKEAQKHVLLHEFSTRKRYSYAKSMYNRIIARIHEIWPHAKK